MKYLSFLAVLLFVACASPKVVYDYDTKTNFSKFKSYSFFEDAGEGFNEFDKKRIEEAIQQELKVKNLQRNDSIPDFYINYLGKQTESNERNTIGVGIGGGGNVGFGISGGIPIGGKKINQELTIDFVEGQNNTLFWQGIANKNIKEKTSPEERKIFFGSVVKKIISGYPPKK